MIICEYDNGINDINDMVEKERFYWFLKIENTKQKQLKSFLDFCFKTIQQY